MEHVLQAHRNTLTAGGKAGIAKTLSKIKSKNEWNTLSADIKNILNHVTHVKL